MVRKKDRPVARPLQPAAPQVVADEAESTGTSAASLDTSFRDKGKTLTLLVGVGASAGGLDAISTFLDALDEDLGCAYFIVQHQADTAAKDTFSSLLGKHSRHPTRVAEDGMDVRPDTVYVAPPGMFMAIFNHKILLQKREAGHGMAIDHFLRSLSQEAGRQAVAVILSGSNSDGTLGARAVRAQGGLVLVQDPAAAAFDVMPRSVVDNGLADLVLTPDAMAGHIAAHARRLRLPPADLSVVSEISPSTDRDKLLMLLRNRSGHNFVLYKDSTVNRRIRRRMDVHRMDRLTDYLEFVRADSAESTALFKDLLIGVTSFFRDPEAFNELTRLLKEEYLPALGRQTFRAWVPGCATGEEAYTLAIILRELLEALALNLEITIYATDLDADAIERARAGLYPENIVADMSRERSARFFYKKGGVLQVRSDIRDMVVFAVQNVIQDPPFSNLDLVSCRNLLMYLKPLAQEKVLAQFQYALRPNGLLLLGSSESVSCRSASFVEKSKKHRLYVRGFGPLRPSPSGLTSGTGQPLDDLPPPFSGPARTKTGPGLRHLAERTLLGACCPPAVLVTQAGDIVFFHGRTGTYLEPNEGLPSANLLDMAREGLRFELSTGLAAAFSRDQEQVRRNVKVKANGHELFVDIHVKPVHVHELDQSCCVVSFVEVAGHCESAGGEAVTAQDDPAGLRIRELSDLLHHTREDMQSVIEEYEAANEELKSSNEELQSTNEELKSTNEELETAKEELQSINEEQTTLNAELQSKNEELAHISDDMTNLLTSTRIATLFLDISLRIKRYTPAMSSIMGLRDSDINRPVGEINVHLQYDQLEADVSQVLQDLNTLTKEIRGRQGDWYQMRINPYRTLNHVIVGVVVTFNDITQLKRSELEAQMASTLAESVINIVQEPLLVLDQDLLALSANHAFYESFSTPSPQSLVGQHFFALDQGRWDSPALRELLDKSLAGGPADHAVNIEPQPPFPGAPAVRVRVKTIRDEGSRLSLLLMFSTNTRTGH